MKGAFLALAATSLATLCGAADVAPSPAAGDFLLRLLAVPMLSAVTDRVSVAAAPVVLVDDGGDGACAYAAETAPTDAVRRASLAGVRRLRIDAGLRHVPDGAFAHAPDVETVWFDGRVRTIGRRAFADSPRLSRLVLEEAMATKIAADAFAGCAADLVCVYPFSPVLTAQDGPVADGEPLFRRILFQPAGHAQVGVRSRGAWLERFVTPVANGDVFFNPTNPPADGVKRYGGVPICWPWFGRSDRPGEPKHGFVRFAKWRVLSSEAGRRATLELRDSPATRAIWPHAFRLTLTVQAESDEVVTLELVEENTDVEPYDTGWGFHPYFAVSSLEAVRLDGEAVRPGVDGVHPAEGRRTRVLEDAANGRIVTVSCSDNEDWVVWNPGPENIARLKGLAPDDWRRFLAVEPCTIARRPLAPGTSRTHRLRIAAAAAGAARTLGVEGASGTRTGSMTNVTR